MTKQERYPTWDDARARLDQVKLAGYSAYAVESRDGESVTLFISHGKHEDLSRLPVAG